MPVLAAADAAAVPLLPLLPLLLPLLLAAALALAPASVALLAAALAVTTTSDVTPGLPVALTMLTTPLDTPAAPRLVPTIGMSVMLLAVIVPLAVTMPPNEPEIADVDADATSEDGEDDNVEDAEAEAEAEADEDDEVAVSRQHLSPNSEDPLFLRAGPTDRDAGAAAHALEVRHCGLLLPATFARNVAQDGARVLADRLDIAGVRAGAAILSALRTPTLHTRPVAYLTAARRHAGGDAIATRAATANRANSAVDLSTIVSTLWENYPCCTRVVDLFIDVDRCRNFLLRQIASRCLK